YEIKIFDYYFKAELDNSFAKVGFEIKNLDF
ncbi:TPA: RNA pseudouridine synthase, partial [Campylobacter jejuni]